MTTKKRSTSPRVVLSSHAVERAALWLPGKKVSQVRGRVMGRLPETLRRGVEVDHDGAVHVKVEGSIYAVCSPMLEGFWLVSTIYKGGTWSMEERERYEGRNSKMTNDEYMQIQHQLTMMAQFISDIDLEGFMARLAKADSMGAALSPTLYRAAMPGMEKIKKLATGARQFQAAVHEVLREEAKER